MPMREIKEDLNKWREITVFIVLKTQHSKDVNSPQKYRVNVIPIEIPERFFFINIGQNI